MKVAPPDSMVEFIALSAGLSASVSATPLNVAVSLARPASPSKVSSPTLVVDRRRLTGVWNGATVVWKVCVASTVPSPS